MAKPIAVLCSDTHNKPRRPDEKFAFSQIVDRAVRLRVPVIAAGDLFDKQSNRSETVTFAYTQLDRLADAGVEFVYIQGQHDWDSPPWFSGHRIAKHLHKREYELGDFVLYGLDWQPFGALQDELASIPASANFLVCHQVWSDWMGDIASPQGSMSQIPGHVLNVLSGDLHQWKLEKIKNADGEKMLVLSCGATAKQKIDEPDEHFFAVLHDDGTIKQQKLKSRVMVDCSLMNRPEDVDLFVSSLETTLAVASQKAAALELPDDMAKPYMRVTYSSKLIDTVRRVEKAVDGRALLFFKQLMPEEKLEAYRKAKSGGAGEAVTPVSMLSEEVDKEEAPAVYSLVERLLGAGDIELEFAKWRTEYLEA